MNSYDTDINIFSNYYNLQSVHFEYNLHFEETQLTPENSNLPLT